MDQASNPHLQFSDFVHASVDEKNDEVSVGLDLKPDKPGKSPEEVEKELRGLYDDFKRVVGVVKQLPEWLPRLETLAGQSQNLDDADNRRAATGSDVADREARRYSDMAAPGPAATYDPGHHDNPDGSSFEVDASGKLTSFTTAAIGQEKGLRYDHLRYDVEGNLSAYQDPWGNTFKRASQPDASGLARWTVSNSFGEPVKYAGADDSAWTGRPSIDQSGVHSLVASGKYAGALYSRLGDGSTAVTYPVADNQSQSRSERFETKVVLPDRSTVTRKSTLTDEGLHADGQLTLKDPDGRTERTVEQLPNKKTFRVIEEKELPDQKDTKSSAIKEIAEKLEKHSQTDGKDPVEGVSEALGKLDRIEAANISRKGDGYHINVQAQSATWLPAVNLHRRFVTAGQTRMDDHFSFDFYPRPDGITVNNMRGFRGSVTGPLGRSHSTYPTSLHIGRDGYGPYVDVSGYAPLRRRTVSSSMRLREHNMPAGSPMIELMDHPEQLQDVTSALRLFQSAAPVNSMSLKRISSSTVDVSLKSPEQSSIPVGEKLGKSRLEAKSIDVEPEVSARIEREKDGVRLENIRGITVAVGTSHGEVKVAPQAIGLKHDSDGKPVLELEIKHPEIDLAQLDVAVPLSGGEKMLESATLKLKLPVQMLAGSDR